MDFRNQLSKPVILYGKPGVYDVDSQRGFLPCNMLKFLKSIHLLKYLLVCIGVLTAEVGRVNAATPVSNPIDSPVIAPVSHSETKYVATENRADLAVRPVLATVTAAPAERWHVRARVLSLETQPIRAELSDGSADLMGVTDSPGEVARKPRSTHRSKFQGLPHSLSQSGPRVPPAIPRSVPPGTVAVPAPGVGSPRTAAEVPPVTPNVPPIDPNAPTLPPELDPELGDIRLRPDGAFNDTVDPELGELQLREFENLTRPRRPPSVYLIGRADYFRSNNIFLDVLDSVDDQLFGFGISVLAVPDLSPRTRLIASVGANLYRYTTLDELNYNNFDLRLGIQQTLLRNTYAELLWRNQQFFNVDGGDRFLNDNSLRFTLSRRDVITPRLKLDSYYQFRASFADPSDRSRIANIVGASLDYDVLRSLSIGLNYQFQWTHFTQRERDDAYHEITLQLSYDLNRYSRINLYGGFSFGRSSNLTSDLNSSILGIVFDTYLSLF